MLLTVTISRKLISGFKIRAVLDIWYPANWRDHCKEGEVDGDEAWWRDAVEFASVKRMMPMGTIHTHTYRKGVTVFDEVRSLGDRQRGGVAQRQDPVFHGPPNNCEVTVRRATP